MGSIEIVASFKGPGNDTFMCNFTKVNVTDRIVHYNVLWRVDGQWAYESTPRTDITDDFLDHELANKVKDGTTVCCTKTSLSFLYPRLITFMSTDLVSTYVNYKVKLMVTGCNNLVSLLHRVYKMCITWLTMLTEIDTGGKGQIGYVRVQYSV